MTQVGVKEAYDKLSLSILAIVGAVAFVLALTSLAGDSHAASAKRSIAVVARGGAGRWERVGAPGASSSLPSLMRDESGVLQVAWVRRTAAGAYSLLDTPISPTGGVGAPTSVLAGWAALGDPDMVDGLGGTFAMFVPGQQTLSPNEPHDGLNAVWNYGREGWHSWKASLWSDEYSYARTPSVAIRYLYAFVAWSGASRMLVRRCYSYAASSRDTFCQGAPDTYFFGPSECCNLGLNIANDGPYPSQMWVAWCSQNQAPAGRWVQALDPLSGAPEGSPARLASSSGPLCESEGREPLVFRPGGGFYVADAAGQSGQEVKLWRIGGPSLTVARSSDSHSRVALAAAPDGRLWVAWRTFHQGDLIHLRRSNPSATRFGAEVTLKAPVGAVEAGRIDLSAQLDRVDVLGTFSFIDSGRDTFFHEQAYPGLTLTARGRRVIDFSVTDAGDPVAAATISVGGRELHTDSQGHASVDLPPGTYRASASKPNYVDARIRVRSTSVKSPA